MFSFSGRATETFFRYGIKKIPKLDNFGDSVTHIIWKYQNPFVKGYCILKFICQYIVLFSLLIDVFYFGKFYYFYKTLILLIVPTLYHALRYWLDDFCNEYLRILKEHIDIQIIDDRICDYRYAWISKTLTYDPEIFYTFCESYYRLTVVLRIFHAISYFTTIYTPAIIIDGIKYFLYATIWGYLIFMMFF